MKADTSIVLAPHLRGDALRLIGAALLHIPQMVENARLYLHLGETGIATQDRPLYAFVATLIQRCTGVNAEIIESSGAQPMRVMITRKNGLLSLIPLVEYQARDVPGPPSLDDATPPQVPQTLLQLQIRTYELVNRIFPSPYEASGVLELAGVASTADPTADISKFSWSRLIKNFSSDDVIRILNIVGEFRRFNPSVGPLITAWKNLNNNQDNPSELPLAGARKQLITTLSVLIADALEAVTLVTDHRGDVRVPTDYLLNLNSKLRWAHLLRGMNECDLTAMLWTARKIDGSGNGPFHKLYDERRLWGSEVDGEAAYAGQPARITDHGTPLAIIHELSTFVAHSYSSSDERAYVLSEFRDSAPLLLASREVPTFRETQTEWGYWRGVFSCLRIEHFDSIFHVPRIRDGRLASRKAAWRMMIEFAAE